MKIAITGGGGFLGGAIVRRLRARGDEVVAIQRGNYPWLKAIGATSVRADLADAATLEKNFRGVDVVFHVAAKAGVWGKYEDYFFANVTGTENVLAACRAAGVSRLVFTSSPSVVFSGQDENGIAESAPYPRRYLAHYPKTKAIAEQAILAANGKNIATIALRPHLIWGPGDPHLVPRVLSRARTGRLRLVGNGSNLVDCTYIDNAADAHLLAADHLEIAAPCAGKPYFISDGQPLAMKDLLMRILRAANLQPVIPTIPPWAAYAAGAALETIHTLLGRRDEPVITRFVARQLARAHWYDISAARTYLGYAPAVAIDEGMLRLAASLQSAPLSPAGVA